jgi:hypothetical protein
VLTLVIRGTGNAGDVDADGVGLGDALAEPEVDGDGDDLAGAGLAESDGEASPAAGWVSGDLTVIATGTIPAATGPG